MRNEQLPTIFKAPSTTRSKFDAICRLGGRTRTSVLVELMNDYILKAGPVVIAKAKTIDKFDPQSSNGSRRHESDELPLPTWSDGNAYGYDRF